MSRQLGSQYMLETALGRGAMGEVWRGADAAGNPLAFKILHESMAGDPATVQRFLQERAILIGLDHPSLVRVHDLVAEGTTLAAAAE